jgi:phenylacetate-CoA ligase
LGADCSCGRGLPVISKIHGRENGFFHLADGRSLVPEFSTRRIREITGASFWQVLQTGPTAVTVRLQPGAQLSASQQLALSQYVQEILGASVSLEIQTVDKFPTTKGGKFYPAMRIF